MTTAERRSPERLSPAQGSRVPGWHLAQLNVARAVGPFDGPDMESFMAKLDEINSLGEAAPGFVWRLKNDDGNTIGIGEYPDPLVVFNLSVWQSIDDLFNFAYRSGHMDVFRRRKEWFGSWDGPSIALWWLPEGTLPTMADALRRLEHLAANGPSPEAFGFRARFAPA